MAIRSIDYEKCINCGQCYEVCPMDVLGRFASKIYIKYPLDCIACYQCIFACKTEALKVDHLRAQPIPVP